MQQCSSYFLHLVASTVSWYGADLTFAQALLTKHLFRGSEPLLSSCFVPTSGECRCIVRSTKYMEFKHAHLLKKWSSILSRVAQLKISYLFFHAFCFSVCWLACLFAKQRLLFSISSSLLLQSAVFCKVSSWPYIVYVSCQLNKFVSPVLKIFPFIEDVSLKRLLLCDCSASDHAETFHTRSWAS